MAKKKVFNDFAKAKWLKKKVSQIKIITDNFGQHTTSYIEAITKFKSETGIDFNDAETEISRLFRSYFAEKSNKEKEKLKQFRPELFE